MISGSVTAVTADLSSRTITRPSVLGSRMRASLAAIATCNLVRTVFVWKTSPESSKSQSARMVSA